MAEDHYLPLYNSSWAILIGVNRYSDRRITNLRGPVSDAQELRDLLISTYNFPEDHIRLLTDRDATKDSILDAIEQMTSHEIDSDDRVLIFFSGHGTIREGRGNTYYLVPFDAQLGDWNSFISQDDFLQKRRHIAAKHILFLIDACHSGAFVVAPKQIAADLDQMLTHSAWQAMGASLPDQTALDAGGDGFDRHSLFTEYLLRGLRGEAARPDGILTVSHLAVYVRDRVAQINNQQVPIFGYLQGSDSGEFVFHLETQEELPQSITRALAGESGAVKIGAIVELESLSTGDNALLSYKSRAKLKELAESAPDRSTRIAANVVTKLSIPILEAQRKGWVKGPLFDQKDNSIFDRIVAAIEYDGRDNFYMNNDGVGFVLQYELHTWDSTSRGEKARFASAVIRAAMNGAWEPQRFLANAHTIPDEWLEIVVTQLAFYYMQGSIRHWDRLSVQAAFNPVSEWVKRKRALPSEWEVLLKATLKEVVPDWYTVHGEEGKTTRLAIWKSIRANLPESKLVEKFLLWLSQE